MTKNYSACDIINFKKPYFFFAVVRYNVQYVYDFIQENIFQLYFFLRITRLGLKYEYNNLSRH